MKTDNENRTKEISGSGHAYITIAKAAIIGVFAAFALFQYDGSTHSQTRSRSDGPADQGNPVKAQSGNKDRGREVFRFETFGTEGFWTDAVRTPQGMVAKKVTPLRRAARA